MAKKSLLWPIAIIGTGIAGISIYKKQRSNRMEKLLKEAFKPCQGNNRPSKEYSIDIEAIDNQAFEPSKFKEIRMKENEVKIWRAFLNDLSGETIKAGFLKKSFSGLLKCNVPLNELCLAKDHPNMFRGIVRRGGKISQQPLFSEAGFSQVAPLLGYSFATELVRQHFKQRLYEELLEIKRVIEKQTQYVNDEKWAILRRAHQTFLHLCKKEHYDLADKVRCERHIDEITDIFNYLEIRLVPSALQFSSKMSNKGEAEDIVKKFYILE